MKSVSILDSLRDGAYLVDKEFGHTTIKGIIKGLLNTGIEYVEMGFLQNEDFGEGKEGKTIYHNAEMAKLYMPTDKKNTLFTVLADYSRYDINKLETNSGKSFDAIRACFFKNERFGAIRFCEKIKEQGYLCFVQPVDILGYSDSEIIEFIEQINNIEPFCFSIVDTFGSMYIDDLSRVFSLIHHNLAPSIHIGFHSHNNMQMSNALSQEFIKMAQCKRKVIIDSTLEGMGRGAGNTPTELIAQYMNNKLQCNYDMDALLDTIDNYMGSIHMRCDWGYAIPYFISGSYSAHVNNVAYLKRKNSIRSKDIRYILNKIGTVERKRYHYDLLEKTYLDYLKSDIDDRKGLAKLQEAFKKRFIVIMAPGKTIQTQQKKIEKYITTNNAIVIQINFISDTIKPDYLYFSNVKRYDFWKNKGSFSENKKIITSNVDCDDLNAIKVSFNSLIKCGWEHVDNSALMLLRLLDKIDVARIGIAGLDGYEYGRGGGDINYVIPEMNSMEIFDTPISLNEEIAKMLDDYFKTRKRYIPIDFITDSRFAPLASANSNIR